MLAKHLTLEYKDIPQTNIIVLQTQHTYHIYTCIITISANVYFYAIFIQIYPYSS